jgi:hypothetical protein
MASKAIKVWLEPLMAAVFSTLGIKGIKQKAVQGLIRKAFTPRQNIHTRAFLLPK